MSDSPLLDCPFCGSGAYVHQLTGRVVVLCAVCPAEMSGTQIVTTITRWNRRVVTSGKSEVEGT